ncbi:MAG TPA: YciI family protein [Pseudonocardia sp.]|jgi:hypothetical protein|nr:YciI family protein [Pseudonocardia sp.]
MTRYLIAVYQPVGAPPSEEFLAPIVADITKVNQEMRDAGVWVFGAGLHPTATATVVRADEGGQPLLTDGPYLEAKEHLGGFSMIEVPDLDAALHWAGKVATALRYLSVEVRPVLDESERSCGPSV